MLPCKLLSCLKTVTTIVGGITLIAVSTTVFSEEFSRGQALYENHCQSCHTDWAHTRSTRKVKDLGDLQRRVATWSNHAGLNWTDEEIVDVADYLERNFYHIKGKP